MHISLIVIGVLKIVIPQLYVYIWGISLENFVVGKLSVYLLYHNILREKTPHIKYFRAFILEGRKKHNNIFC